VRSRVAAGVALLIVGYALGGLFGLALAALAALFVLLPSRRGRRFVVRFVA